MNRLLFSTLLALLFLGNKPSQAQKPGLPYNRFTGEITQTKLVETGQSREKTYKAIRCWILKKYPNHREIIKIDEPGPGKIVLQDSDPIAAGRFKSITYKIHIDIKDGSYSCTINNVMTLTPGTNVYRSADQDFSRMGMYGKDIDDIDREISITRNKKQRAKLYQKRQFFKSLLADYDKSHVAMDIQFTRIQNSIFEATNANDSLAAN